MTPTRPARRRSGGRPRPTPLVSHVPTIADKMLGYADEYGVATVAAWNDAHMHFLDSDRDGLLSAEGEYADE